MSNHPVNIYSPEQYERVVEVWERLAKLAGNEVSSDTLHEAVLSDGERDRIELSFCYSSDYSGSDVDRANARCLHDEFGFLGHLDNHGAWSESYVYMTLGELPTDEDTDIDEAIEQLEKLARELEYVADDYPLLDEQYLYDLESEIEEESWDAWFMSAFRSQVAKELGCDEYELEEDLKVTDDELKELFYDLQLDMESRFVLENATSGYFEDWEWMAQLVADHIVKSWAAPLVDPNQIALFTE